MTSRIEGRSTGRRELIQALEQWVGTVRQCRDADANLYEDLEPPHDLCLVSVWARAEALADHLAGPEFGNLVGAVELLATDSSVVVSEADHDAGDLAELRRRHAAGPADADRR